MFQFRKPTPVVGATLILLVAMFVVTAMTTRVAGAGLYYSLSLEPQAVLHGERVWGVLTYALLHSLDDTGHLLFNGLAFYFFAPQLEELWGKTRFIVFMLVSALGAGAMVLATSAAAAAMHMHGPDTVVGFSGVVMAVLAAWGLIFPEQEMYFFVVRLKGLHMLYLTVAIELLGAVALSNVASSAHFGGLLVGAVWAAATTGAARRWWLRRRLGRLQRESASLRDDERMPRRRAGGPPLRLIHGGDDKPKDKRYLN